MTDKDLKGTLKKLLNLSHETEWVEFKHNYSNPEVIGEYISALSNSACILNEPYGFLIYGIDDETHQVIGTTFNPHQTKRGNEDIEPWLARLLNPRIDFIIRSFKYNERPIVLIRVDAAKNIPVNFSGTPFIRIGSHKKKLLDYPEKERKIWNNVAGDDWSAEIVDGASLDDLDVEAIAKARKNYKEKHPHLKLEVDNWDDLTFLSKARVLRNKKVTRTALLLLGKPESEEMLIPFVAKIKWILQNESGNIETYKIFGPPFMLNTDAVFKLIRNYRYQYIPDQTLFPREISKYEPYVIRETLHNCIAHQDYKLKGSINVVEKPEELIFTNVGNFFAGTPEEVVERDTPYERYRNFFLANAMVELNMIDTIGSGIKRMFSFQRERFFPMPEYDLSDHQRVMVTIYGKVLSDSYTRLLHFHPELDLKTIIELDRIQKRKPIRPEVADQLRKLKLIEGRKPNYFISLKVAQTTERKAKYIKNKAFDDQYYKDLIANYLAKFSEATREDIDKLLHDKFTDLLTQDQKKNKVRNLLAVMSKKEHKIVNRGTNRKPIWSLTKDQ